MDEMNDVGFDEFRAAFSGDGYQTENTEDSAEVVTEQETLDDASVETSDGESSEATGDENSEDEHTSDSEENGSDGESGATDTNQNTDTPQTFTIKVNKEEKNVTLEEMTALAQKGADYDRVKEQYRQGQQTIQELSAKLDGMASHQEAIDILNLLAEKTGTSVDDLAKALYRNFRKSGGASEETADLELENAKLKKSQDAANAQAAQQEEQQQADAAEARAQRDIADFEREYPGVELTEELVDKLVPDIQGGMSLTAAYRKLERSQEKERIAELERQLAAEKQNNKNKRSSPGSQKDSGASAKKTDFDEFAAAFR